MKLYNWKSLKMSCCVLSVVAFVLKVKTINVYHKKIKENAVQKNDPTRKIRINWDVKGWNANR